MPAIWTPPYTWVPAKHYSSKLNEQLRDNMLFLKSNILLGAAGALEISDGQITITQTYHKIAGEDNLDDELDTISGGGEGRIIILRPDGNIITLKVKDGAGNLEIGNDIVLATDDDHIALVYDGSNWHTLIPVSSSITRAFVVNTFQYPAPGTDWTPTIKGAYLAASKAAKKCWLPLNFLKIGDVITSYNLVGDAIETTALTLDCKLVQVNKANPLTTTDITNGAIAQVTIDGNFDITANCDDTTIATDKQYLLEIEGTTDTSDEIYVIGAEVTIIRLL